MPIPPLRRRKNHRAIRGDWRGRVPGATVGRLDSPSAMRIHHLNCGTLCPNGARLVNGKGGLLEPARIVCHCLLIEADDGLVLLDTGFGTEDTRNPRQLGVAFAMMRPRAEIGETALKQVEGLGFAAEDVKQIVTTHLD